jgi:hypothetical protein
MVITRFTRSLSLAALIAAGTFAQACPTGSVGLMVALSTSSAGQHVLHVSVTGTPAAYAVLLHGPALGQATLPGGPAGGTVVCLAAPFGMTQLGQIPPGGTLTTQFPAPPLPPGATIHFQALTMAPPLPPTVDTSNTASVTVPQPPPPPPCTPGAVQLTILPDVQVQPGNTISITITGTPGAHVHLVRSHALGSTPVPVLPSPLCLAQPLSLMFTAVIPASGTLTMTHVVPPNATLPGNVTIWFQAVTAAQGPGGMIFDTSNTDFLML